MKTSLDTSKIGKTDVVVTKIGMGGAPLGGLDSRTAQPPWNTPLHKEYGILTQHLCMDQG